jgi:hypothetical protein
MEKVFLLSGVAVACNIDVVVRVSVVVDSDVGVAVIVGVDVAASWATTISP